MSQDVANTAIRDEAAEKYEAKVESKHGSHWDCCYSSYTVQDAFEAGWDARDEEVNRLKRSLVEFALAESAHVEEVKRLTTACKGAYAALMLGPLVDQQAAIDYLEEVLKLGRHSAEQEKIRE